MPKLSEFIGPKPTHVQNENLEKVIGEKPCSKCDKDAGESYWDPTTLILSWTCPDGHQNTFKVN
jgi:hypothetical protein